MTATLVNLRQARKRKARNDKAGEAAENRLRHGRTLDERKAKAAAEARAAAQLDGHRLEPRGSETGESRPEFR